MQCIPLLHEPTLDNDLDFIHIFEEAYDDGEHSLDRIHLTNICQQLFIFMLLIPNDDDNTLKIMIYIYIYVCVCVNIYVLTCSLDSDGFPVVSY